MEQAGVSIMSAERTIIPVSQTVDDLLSGLRFAEIAVVSGD